MKWCIGDPRSHCSWNRIGLVWLTKYTKQTNMVVRLSHTLHGQSHIESALQHAWRWPDLPSQELHTWHPSHSWTKPLLLHYERAKQHLGNNACNWHSIICRNTLAVFSLTKNLSSFRRLPGLGCGGSEMEEENAAFPQTTQSANDLLTGQNMPWQNRVGSQWRCYYLPRVGPQLPELKSSPYGVSAHTISFGLGGHEGCARYSILRKVWAA